MPVIEINDDDHLDTLVNEYEYVLVDFYINACVPCKQFAPVYEELSELYPTICFVKVNAYAPKCKEIADEYNVSKFPTFIILENNNRELLHEPIMGVNKDVICNKLDSLINITTELDDNDF